MALSEHEQQMLKEIEQSLLSEDPKFGAVVTDGDFAQSKGTVTLRGIAIVVIGLVLLVLLLMMRITPELMGMLH